MSADPTDSTNDYVYLVYFSDLEYIGSEWTSPPINGRIFNNYQKALNYAQSLVKANIRYMDLRVVNSNEDDQLIGTNEEFNVVWLQKVKLNEIGDEADYDSNTESDESNEEASDESSEETNEAKLVKKPVIKVVNKPVAIKGR